MLIVRLLVGAWALISIILGALAFFVMIGYDTTIVVAVKEAFETVPEAVMMKLGFEGAPLAVTAAYWVALVGAVYFAFKSKRPR